jgi:hypothetical protein
MTTVREEIDAKEFAGRLEKAEKHTGFKRCSRRGPAIVRDPQAIA